MQKFRVICPHCSATLLVTEDLLGQAGNCPGCQQAFLLPTRDYFDEAAGPANAPPPRPQSPVPTPPAPTRSSTPTPTPAVPPPPLTFDLPLLSPAPVESRKGPATTSSTPAEPRNPVKIENRALLRLFSNWLKYMAVLQIVVAFIALIGMLFVTASYASGANAIPVILTGVVTAIYALFGALASFALAELLLVFMAQEELLRHILNELRAWDHQKRN